MIHDVDVVDEHGVRIGSTKFSDDLRGGPPRHAINIPGLGVFVAEFDHFGASTIDSPYQVPSRYVPA